MFILIFQNKAIDNLFIHTMINKPKNTFTLTTDDNFKIININIPKHSSNHKELLSYTRRDIFKVLTPIKKRINTLKNYFNKSKNPIVYKGFFNYGKKENRLLEIYFFPNNNINNYYYFNIYDRTDETLENINLQKELSTIKKINEFESKARNILTETKLTDFIAKFTYKEIKALSVKVYCKNNITNTILQKSIGKFINNRNINVFEKQFFKNKDIKQLFSKRYINFKNTSGINRLIHFTTLFKYRKKVFGYLSLVLKDENEEVMNLIKNITSIAAININKLQHTESIKILGIKQKSLFDNINDAVLIWDKENNCFFDVNKQACKLYGYKRQEFLKVKMDKYFKYNKLAKKRISSILKQKKSAIFDAIHYRVNGDEISVVVKVGVVKIMGKDFISFICRDMTKEKKLIERLEKSETKKLEFEKKLSSLSSIAFDAIIIMNGKGEMVFWNKAAEKMFGYTESEIIGKNLHLLLAPNEFMDNIERGIKRFKASGEGNVFGKINHLTACKKNGEKFSIELSVSKLKINGEWNAIGIVRDVSKRLEAEEELRINKERYQAVVEIQTEYILRTNTSGQFTFVNNAFSSLLNVKPEVLFGKSYTQFSSPQTSEMIEKQIVLIQQTKDTTRIEHLSNFPNGVRKWIEWVASPIFNFKGEITEIQCVGRDITELKETQKEIEFDRSMLKEISDSKGLGYYVVRTDNEEIEYVNRSFCDIFQIEYLYEKLNKGHLSHSILINYLIINLANKENFKNSFITLNNPLNETTFEDEIKFESGKTIKRYSTILKLSEKKHNSRIYIFEDITRQKTLETYRKSEEEYKNIVEEAPDAIVITDTNGKIINVNARLCKITGYQKNEVLNKYVTEFFDEKELAQKPFRLKEVSIDNSIITKRLLKQKNGNLLQIESNATLLPNNTIHAILRDISERNYSNIELLQDIKSDLYENIFTKLKAFRHGDVTLMNLSRLSLYAKNINVYEYYSENSSLNQIVNRFKNTINEFISAVHPQIKHLSTITQIFEPELPEIKLVNEIRRISCDFEISNDRLKILLENLINDTNSIILNEDYKLEIIKSIKEIKKHHAEISNFIDSNFSADITEILTKIVEIYSFSFKDININLTNYNNSLFGIINPGEFREIISILLDNSYESLLLSDKRPNQIFIKTILTNGIIKIEFSDNGSGIQNKNKGTIFEKGFSTKGDKRGFGLHYALECAKKYGGKLYLDDKYKDGAKFIIELKNKDN